MVAAPSALRFTAAACPARHLEAAALLGADVRDVPQGDASAAGEVLARALVEMMQKAGVPGGLEALGYRDADLAPLVEGAIVQQRLLGNAPREVDRATLHDVFRGALRYF